MKVANQKAMSLGYVERHGEKKDGTHYDIYFLAYIVEGEQEARKMYMQANDYGLMRSCKEYGKWGQYFSFTGDVDARGNIQLETLCEVEHDD